MPRALITLVFAISLSAMTICAALGPVAGHPADHDPLFVEAASPQLPVFAMTIL